MDKQNVEYVRMTTKQGHEVSVPKKLVKQYEADGGKVLKDAVAAYENGEPLPPKRKGEKKAAANASGSDTGSGAAADAGQGSSTK